MDYQKMIADLRDEAERLQAAIEALEQLARGAKRRGRPPKWLAKKAPAGSESEPPPKPSKK